MKYFLKELFDKYDLLLRYREKLVELGYLKTELRYIDGMIYNHKSNLNDFNNHVLQLTLRNHSNYRLRELVCGERNLVDLLFYPEEYVLNPMNEDQCAIMLNDTIVFKATDNKFYVFSPIERVKTGLVYKGEKWQKFK